MGRAVTVSPGAGRQEWNAAGVVARLRSLIDARDAGDAGRAASRLGVSVDALRQLSAALADDGRDDAQAPADGGAAEVLAAAARAYQVDATWLVTGEEDFHGDDLAPGARIRVADLLLRVGHRLLDARRRGRDAPAEPAVER